MALRVQWLFGAGVRTGVVQAWVTFPTGIMAVIVVDKHNNDGSHSIVSKDVNSLSAIGTVKEIAWR